MYVWDCTGKKCGKCKDASKNSDGLNAFQLSVVAKYYKILHSDKKPAILICKECNRDAYMDKFNIHLTECKKLPVLHSWVLYTYSVRCGKYYGKEVYVNYASLMNSLPQLICLRSAGSSISEIVDDSFVASQQRKGSTNALVDSWDIDKCKEKIIFIKMEHSGFNELMQEILKRMIICVDCGHEYDITPTVDIVAKHLISDRCRNMFFWIKNMNIAVHKLINERMLCMP